MLKRKMNDYDFSTPETNEGPEFECCEMKIEHIFVLVASWQ